MYKASLHKKKSPVWTRLHNDFHPVYKRGKVPHMMMTFDFLITAKHNPEFRKKLENAISSNLDCEICTERHRLTFLSKSQSVIITAANSSSDFSYKIPPKKVTYRAFIKILNDEWDSIVEGDIVDV